MIRPDAAPPAPADTEPARGRSTDLRGVSPPDPVGARLRARRCALGRSLRQVAAAAGCSRSYLSQIENARVPPPAAALLARLELALDFQEGELTGPARAGRRRRDWRPGAGLRRDLARLEGALARLTGWLAGAPAEDGPRIPVITAPCGESNSPAAAEDGPAEFIAVPGLRDRGAFAVRVRGDGLEPQYRAGDLVVFSPARPARSGADCFVRLRPDGRGVFARVYFTAAGPVRLHPLNSAHAPRLVPRTKIAGLHPAITVIRSIG